VELLTWLEEMSRLAERPFWVGHNIAGFDLPILLRTAWKFRHPVAKLLPRVNRSELVYDTQERWKATDRYGKGVRLDALAEFLGLAGKLEGMAGSEVYPAWLRGEHERIQRYCRQDVELVRDVYCVMEGLHEPA
jgi:predicted PolB exonuclease-like 3'-5' exonuclease